jgi:hypothetical protein
MVPDFHHMMAELRGKPQPMFYSYFIDRITEERHQEILNKINWFLEDKEMLWFDNYRYAKERSSRAAKVIV